MAKVTFEIEIESEEIPQAYDMLRDIVEAFEFPVYEIGCKYGDGTLETQIGGSERKEITLPPVKELTFQEFVEAVGLQAFDEEDLDDTDPCIVMPGEVVELPNGLVYQVFSIDATGRVVLDVLEELTDEEVEDEFLCPPTRH